MAFGYVVCLDAFLYNFTILPLRIAVSLVALGYQVLYRMVRWRRPSPGRRWLCCSQSDLLKGLMMVGAGIGLQQVDSSRLYHSIRGQSTLKLYVIYNVLEVADKLCCSFGLDILDSFFSTDDDAAAAAGGAESGSRVRPIPHFLLTILYVCTPLSPSIISPFIIIIIIIHVSDPWDSAVLPGNHPECGHQLVQ